MNKENFTFNYSLDINSKSKKLSFRPLVIWFYGLSGSGKSTLCNLVEIELYKKNIQTVVLDGDSLRNTINRDLGFSNKDRDENIRRVSEISKILFNSGLVTLCSFITPLNIHRENIEKIIGRENIFWIFVDTSLEICLKRDPKKLYSKALKGEIKNFTGVSAPFDIPLNYDFKVDSNIDLKVTTTKIMSKILERIKI